MELSLLQILEITAAVSGLIHVFLLSKEKVIAWPFGILTVAIYVYIFYVLKLYSDSILHVFYILLNFYGWYNWTRKKQETTLVAVSRLSPASIAWLIGIIVTGTTLWGYTMQTNTDADLPYFDAFTTVASLSAQYLLTQKKIDNWIVWIIVDLVAIPMYLYKGVYVTAGLYFVYLLICISGLQEWRSNFNENENENEKKPALINRAGFFSF